jgi:hypothetical protein
VAGLELTGDDRGADAVAVLQELEQKPDLSGLPLARSIKPPHQFFEEAAGALSVHRDECVRRHSESTEGP